MKKQNCKNLVVLLAINYNSEKFKDGVLEITNGKKVPVVFDSVGKDTSDSLDCDARTHVF